MQGYHVFDAFLASLLCYGNVKLKKLYNIKIVSQYATCLYRVGDPLDLFHMPTHKTVKFKQIDPVYTLLYFILLLASNCLILSVWPKL